MKKELKLKLIFKSNEPPSLPVYLKITITKKMETNYSEHTRKYIQPHLH